MGLGRPSSASLTAVGMAGGLWSWGTFSQQCREGAEYYHSRSRAQTHSCCPSLWKCILQESDPHIITPKWFWRLMVYLCMQSLLAHFHFIAVSSLLSQNCSLSLWLLRLIWPAPSLFCYKYLPISALGTLFAYTPVQRAKKYRKKELSLLLVLNLQIHFLCFIPCLFCFQFKFCRVKRAGCGGFENTA